jgi:hypothetical protein
VPDPADAGNAGVSFLKNLLKNLPPGPARESVEQMIKNPDDWGRVVETVGAMTKNLDEFKALDNSDVIVRLLREGPQAVELVARYGEDGVALINRFGENGLELLLKQTDDLPLDKVNNIANLGFQDHHILTDKYLKRYPQWTEQFEDILENYDGLGINGEWNIINIPHAGSHAEEYHEWVYEELLRIDEIANGNEDEFLKLFDIYIKQHVLDNPLIIRREWYP